MASNARSAKTKGPPSISTSYGKSHIPRAIAVSEQAYTTAAPAKEVMDIRDKIVDFYISLMQKDRIIKKNQKPTVPQIFDYIWKKGITKELALIIIAEKEKTKFNLEETLFNLPILRGMERTFIKRIVETMPKELKFIYERDYTDYMQKVAPLPDVNYNKKNNKN